ncbi:MAG: pilus assembly protein [Alphaproteobacteria bacterium]|nr:pilus assembly protein [Alphaproteobacteria bacterium]
MRYFVRMLRNDQGVSAIQFAFVAPMLVFLTVAIIDIGRLGLTSTSVRYAVFEGARFAIAHGANSQDPKTDDEIKTFTATRAIGIPVQASDVVITRDPDDDNPGSKVTITLDVPLNLFAEGFTPLAPTTITRSATMTVF